MAETQRQDKRAAALHATLALIAEQGFHATPMSQIAVRANIGVGTIYRYFSGKDDLINSLYVDVKTKVARHILKNYSETDPVAACFSRMMSDTVLYFIQNPLELSFTEQYENSPLITSASREEGARISLPVTKLFSRAHQQGLLKDLPIDTLGSMISGATISLAKLYRFKTPDQATLNKAVDAIWDMAAL